MNQAKNKLDKVLAALTALVPVLAQVAQLVNALSRLLG